ncbi:hypothetical protein [Streptomonospora wellingtoniae]|uniref:Uncharacterized protein n=1 Tax=Streptomonospora wellingtoniae TaxID=3075544 RepID=A0ABU2KV11_9ACTN|nr:hypothetical protein [Streptomonospora sp. DSM 45055]MDT0303007.1 hypothetical protein [Streptomonospora sp. DSM 45055]
MTPSRLAPDWRRICLGAALGAAGTAAVGLAVHGAAALVAPLTADQVVGANIGLGLVAFALRLAATPLVCWWLLRLVRVPRAGAATLFGLVCYLLLALAGWGDPALPGVAAVWVVLGAVSGAVGVYAAGCTAPRTPAARA